VVPGESLEEALRSVAREIGEPLVVDLTIDGADEVAPSSLPDLFRGRAVAVYLRPTGNRITVRGKRAGGRPFEETVTVKEVDLPAIPHLWARARIADLEDAYRMDPAKQEEISKQIIELSIRHTVLSRFTAFLAVDESGAVNPQGHVRRVVQPVHAPAGWQTRETMMRACVPMSHGLRASAPDSGRLCRQESGLERLTTDPTSLKKLQVMLRRFLETAIEGAIAGRLPENQDVEQARLIVAILEKSPMPFPEGLLERLDRVLKEILQGRKAGSLTLEDVRQLLEPCLRDLGAARKKKPFWSDSV